MSDDYPPRDKALLRSLMAEAKRRGHVAVWCFAKKLLVLKAEHFQPSGTDTEHPGPEYMDGGDWGVPKFLPPRTKKPS